MLITDKVWEVPFEITYLHYQTEKPYKPFISFAYSLWQPSNFTRNNDYKGLLMSPFGVKNGGFSNLALSATFGFRKSIKETASIEFGMRYAFERERVDNIVEISEYNLTNNQNASGDLNKLYLNDYNLLQTHRISLFFNYLFVFQKKNK